MRLDKKDFRILFELDRDARQSLAGIGKRVRLPKTVVAYRMKRLEKTGVIRNYYAFVDASRLGYTSLRFYLTFHFTTPAIEAEIIDYFCRDRHTWWVASTGPQFDLSVIRWVRDNSEFYAFWEETLRRYGSYFKEARHSFYFEAVHYRYEYLLGRTAKKEPPEIIGGASTIKIDEIELSLLRLLATDARLPVTEIALRLKTTPKVIQYRLQRLFREKVIVGCRVALDIAKLDKQNFRLNFQLKDYRDKEKIESFVTRHPGLIYINRAIGETHLEYDMHLASAEELQAFVDQVRSAFPGALRSYDYFAIKRVHKEQPMPLVPSNGS